MRARELRREIAHVRDALAELVWANVLLARHRTVVGNADPIEYMSTLDAIWDAYMAGVDLLETLEGVLACS